MAPRPRCWTTITGSRTPGSSGGRCSSAPGPGPGTQQRTKRHRRPRTHMEQTLNKPLGGDEVARAIAHDILAALLRQSHFGAHLAYTGFAFTGTITVRTPGAQREGFAMPVLGARGAPVPDDAYVVTVEA